MSTDDPFGGDGDRTQFKPTPGGRRRAGGAAPPPAGQPPPAAPPPPTAGQPVKAANLGSGVNPLVDTAGSLLSIGAQLRNTATHPDPGGLCRGVAAEVKAFEAAARERGVSPENLIAARYCLCTFLDEVVLSTPWGSESEWSTRTLLVTFHNEVFGGEKFFAILDRVLLEPARNIDLLELLSIILSLGFQGKYRVQEMGVTKLAHVQENLAQVIRTQRGEYERQLSPHWRGLKDLTNPLARYVPMWVLAAVAGAVLLAGFVGFRFALNAKADPVYSELRTLAREPRPLVTGQRTAPVRSRADLAGFLADEIREGLVAVTDEPGRSKVVVRGAGLFASGSARLNAAAVPLIRRIADGLNTVPGRVLVTGHTDSDPIPRSRRLKFASNQALSQQRAEAVLAVLQDQGVAAPRLEADGRADTEELVPNTSRENKARNRRVEVILWTR